MNPPLCPRWLAHRAHLVLVLLSLGWQEPEPALPPNPKDGAVELETSATDWKASLVLDRGPVGIWTVKPFDVFPQYACPELVGLDDAGRCWVLVSYSGKWTPLPSIEEGKWLGGLAHGDVDPRADGAEIYCGGQKGNLYQVRAYPFTATDHRLIARFPGEEIHTIVAGDLDPRSPGAELFVFTSPGRLYRVSPTGPDGTFDSVSLAPLVGRVRDAIVLPPTSGEPAGTIATVSRGGRASLLHVDADAVHWRTIHKTDMGKGRIALAPSCEGRGTVLYTTQDDGAVLRHERIDGDWRTEIIYRGPQGPRGLAAGAFHADPNLESVAVFGYSSRVELLTRGAAGWSAETIFEDRDKGHWLSACEVDSRNGTPELVGSGYGGRIFVLARPVGFGVADGK